RGDRRSDREQGTGSVGRGQGELQAFAKGHLIWPAWRTSVTPRVWWAHPRSALRRGQGPRDQGPLEDDQGSAPGRGQPEDRPQGLLAVRASALRPVQSRQERLARARA